MHKKIQNSLLDLLALIAGALLPLGFAPLNLTWLTILSPALLLLCLTQVTPMRAMWRGWLFGLGQFGVGVSWVFVSIHVYGESPVWLAAFITLLFVSILALCPAILSYLLVRLFPLGRWLIAFPALWVISEWLRSWLFTGFPWLLLGYSQTDTLLRGYLPIIGVYGVSFLVVLVNVLLFTLCKRIKHGWMVASCIATIALIYLFGYGLLNYSWTKQSGEPVQVSLVQGNIPQDLKWMSDYLDQSLLTYQRLSNHHWDSDIIVWPESAVPIPRNNAQNFLDDITARAEQTSTTLITGIPVDSPICGKYYNGIITLGTGSGEYFKRRLVPFGEYMPFEGLFSGLITFFNLPMTNFISGPTEQSDIHADGIPLGSFICYEIAYSTLVREAMPEAQLLVTLSNDAWFGDSFAPAQHLQIARAQSIQVGREQLFATNDGITALIDARGHLVDQLPQFATAVLTGQATPYSGSTPWTRWGEWPIIILLFLLLGASVTRYKFMG